MHTRLHRNASPGGFLVNNRAMPRCPEQLHRRWANQAIRYHIRGEQCGERRGEGREGME